MTINNVDNIVSYHFSLLYFGQDHKSGRMIYDINMATLHKIKKQFNRLYGLYQRGSTTMLICYGIKRHATFSVTLAYNKGN